MCVAVIKPAGVNIPAEETLRACWNKNPHGAGIGFYDAEENAIHVEKGFMNKQDFLNYCDYLRDKIVDVPAFLHFRISTGGGVCPELTHPFPVVNDKRLIRKTSFYAYTILMHNGIIKSPDDKSLSDTAELAMAIARGKCTPSACMELLEYLTTSNKFAIMYNKEIYTGGNWETEKDGCKYSNVLWDIPKIGFDGWEADYGYPIPKIKRKSYMYDAHSK